MQLAQFDSGQSPVVIAHFQQVFSDSEGETEGRLIGELVSELIQTTKADDLYQSD
ncbi:hypothetical protein [Thalassotalea sp. PLHSN55]|uniref:hypothetical protein n=1 Tax=Thalassotalea sp. PLHSN55 TaxID=3435888 RepID=UPI003F8698F8